MVDTLGRVLHAIYVGGAFRVVDRPLPEATLAVAIDGEWAFADREFVDLVAALVDEERRFWRDLGDPYFLITLLQTGRRCCGYGGTGLSNGYATFVSTDGPIDGRLRRLIAHEMFHTWNGRKIPRAPPEEAITWFSEGFTDYYARLLGLRAGVLDLGEYIDEYDGALEALYRSPLRTIDDQAIAAGFWRGPMIEKIPYHRGDALAHRLNRELRRASGDRASLDTVMRRILRAAQEDGEAVSTALVAREVAGLGGEALARELREVAVQGSLPTPPEDALGPCVALEWVTMPSIDLGFAAASVGEGIVRDVDPASDAHAQGVRAGQRLVEVVPPRRVEQRARIVVEGAGEGEGAGAGEEKVLMVDVAGPPIAVPRYRMKAGARADDPACLRWFADVEGAGER